MGKCFSMLKINWANRPKDHSVQEVTSEEYQTESEENNDVSEDADDEEWDGHRETDQGLSGWDQYHMWVRKHLLEEWSARDEERRRSGRDLTQCSREEDFAGMLMFGLASKGIKPSDF